MSGSGGCIPATPEFLTMLREVTAECAVILIFDEVMTSRLGPGGYQEVSGDTGHDDHGQVSRRRPDLWRFWRQTGDHGTLRSGPSTT